MCMNCNEVEDEVNYLVDCSLYNYEREIETSKCRSTKTENIKQNRTCVSKENSVLCSFSTDSN